MPTTGLTIEFITTKLIEAQQYYAELVNQEYIDLQNNAEGNSDLKSNVFWLYNLIEALKYRIERDILDDITIILYLKLERRIGVGTSTQIVLDPYYTNLDLNYTIDISIDLSSYALDSQVVHKTTNETIDGVKTFLLSPVIPTATNSNQALNLGQGDSRYAPITGGYVTNVNGVTNRITSTGGINPIIDISSSYIGQTSITNLGTITTGVWNSTPIVDSYISSSSIWNAKQNAITLGDTSQYFRGDLSLATFPSSLPPSGVAGGDLTGTYPNPIINTINSITKSYYDPTSSIQTQLNSKQATLGGSGIVKSTVGTISYLTDNSTDWNTAFTQTRQWDGGTTGLVAATGRTSLGLGTLATQNGTFSGASSGTNTGDQTITLTGEVTGSGTGSFTTTLTNSAVIGKVLTGYTSGAGTVAATDNILQAIQKLNGNIGALVTGVSSFNTRTGTVSLTSGDVTTALTFTPENITNKTAISSSSTTTYPNWLGVTNYAAITTGYATPQQYGADGTGVIDDTSAINACLAANLNVRFYGTYLVTGTLTIRSEHNIFSEHATINFSSSTLTLFSLNALNNVKMHGKLIINGAAGTIGTAIAIDIIGGNSNDISGIYFSLINGTCIQIDPSTTFNRGNAALIHDNFFVQNYTGVVINARTLTQQGVEYYQFSNNVFRNNTNPVISYAGNQNWVNNNIVDNTNGVYIDGSGINAAHDTWTGNNINHNSAYGVQIVNNPNGMFFTGTRVIGSNPIILINSLGTSFTGGVVDGVVTIDASSTLNLSGVYLYTSYGVFFNENKITYIGCYTSTGAAQPTTNTTFASSTDILGRVTMTLGSDATADTYYRNSGGLLTRLGIGSNGDLSTVSGGLPSYAAPSTITVGNADKWTTGRTLSITGDIAYTSPSFDGSGNVTAAGTLASVISAGGPIGSATVTPIITYDAKGRLTTVSSATITPAIGSITGLGTGVATALAVNTGTAGAFALNNQTMFIGTTSVAINRASATLNLAGIGTLGVSNTITSTIGNNTKFFGSAAATTGYQYGEVKNTGGQMYWGVENSTGATIFGSGSTPYMSGVGSENLTDFGIVTNNNTRLVVSSTGNFDFKSGTATFGNTVNLKNYTVATLPAGTRGDIAYVTDALAPSFLVAVVGGGTVVTPVFYNGTTWVAQ